jgi:hypothetical protein
MVQIGNYNYSDYYSSGAYAPREGTLSYAEFDPDAYLAVRPDVAQDRAFTGQLSRDELRSISASMTCSCGNTIVHLPVMNHVYAHYQGIWPGDPVNQRPDQVGLPATGSLIHSADQNQTYQQSRDIRLLEVL